MRIWVLMFIGIAFVSDLCGQYRYFFEKISPNSGFTFSAISNITEDANGFVWFGTVNAIYYNNTLETREYQLQNNSLKKSSPVDIHKIYNDDSSRLWVCSDQGLFQFDFGEDQFFKKELNFVNATQNAYSVENILQLDQERYLITVNQQLYAYSIGNDSVHKQNLEHPGHTGDVLVTTFSRDENANVLLGTSTGKVLLLNEGFSVSRELHSPVGFPVKSICPVHNNYYIGYDGYGVEVVDSRGEVLNVYKEHLSGNNQLPDNRVRRIVKRKDDIWIGTYEGLVVVNSLYTRVIKSDGMNGLQHNSIYEIYKNEENNMWIGTWSGGLSYFSEYSYSFRHFLETPTRTREPGNVISSFAEDMHSKIWVGNEQSGLSLFNQHSLSFDNQDRINDLANLIHIKSVASSNGTDIWIGTFTNGVWHYHIPTSTLEKIHPEEIHDDFVISHLQVVDNTLWVSTRRNGLFAYDLSRKVAKHLTLDKDLRANWIWRTLIKDGQMWLCTDGGLYRYDIQSDSYKECVLDSAEEGSSDFAVYSIAEDHKGHLWIGTLENGLYSYDCAQNLFEKKDLDEQIDHANIYGILRDHHNNMWFSSSKGIYYYNTELDELNQYTTLDGISGEVFNPNSAFVSSSGLLFFGSPNGFNIIDPDLIEKNPIVPEVFLSEFKINNRHLTDFSEVLISSKHIETLRSIELQPDQNSLSFRFVSNNFIKSAKNKFRYRLLNYQDHWTETSLNQEISFTKIPPGSYILEVIGSNNDNLWSSTPIQVSIRILPPLGRTPLAYVVYALLLSALIFLITKQLAFRIKARKEIVNQKYLNEANELLYSEKLRFFTNISHEIRTPLTLIISPLNALLKRFQYDHSTFHQLNIIKRNSNRLLRLTNQILDFRLMEVGKLKIKVEECDVVNICKNVYECFELEIIEKQINFVFRSAYKSFFVKADADMLEKIIYNLVSNALKFSNEKGQIILSVDSKEIKTEAYEQAFYVGKQFTGRAVLISVRDFGKGIKKGIKREIFNRFFGSQESEFYGAGIGLNLCQEYAKLNGANIFVKSKENKGSRFSLHIPAEESNTRKRKVTITQPHFDKSLSNLALKEGMEKTKVSNAVVLIAEDNDELRIYLRNILSERYKVLSAMNGNQALEIAVEVIPDLMVIDILMPGMNGMDLLKALKENPATSFIPIVVLTALTEDNYQIESILEGADLYLTKPVDESVLIAHIENILLRRSRLKSKYGKSSEEQELKEHGSMETFVQAAERIIEKNLQNVNFDTKDLAGEMKISRSTLYRKMKKTSSQNPTEFIRNTRLKFAVQLLKTGKYNMVEVGYFVGFNSASYFNSSFKKKYGMTPKEYIKRQNISMST